MSDSLTRPHESVGDAIHGLARELWPIARSITGDGVRRTLEILGRELPGLRTVEVATGTQCFDWTVPDEWNIRDAYLVAPDGRRFAEFRNNNLHVVGYSTPVDETLSLDELTAHLHSLPEQPDAIPYITSYYSRRWGFCLSQRQRNALEPGEYRAVIDSTLAPGSLTYAELVIPGETRDEVFLSTYICHPSLANNELSGPTVTTYLAKWLLGLERRRYTYRIAFVPETIGSIVYLSRNLEHLKRHVVAGFNVTCVGDDRTYSYLPSRAGDTPSDRVAIHVLSHIAPDFARYSFLDRGSDERQYCSPGVDLPIASVMRTKYGEYPEYHTSLDDLSITPPAGLFGGYNALRHCLLALEHNRTYRTAMPCEPQLGKRGLYPTLSTRATKDIVRTMMDILAYSDGEHDLLSICELTGVPIWTVLETVEKLVQAEVLVPMDEETSRAPSHQPATVQ